MGDELYINVRLEGNATFHVSANDQTRLIDQTETDITVPCATIITCGKTDWPDEPYRGEAVTKFLTHGTGIDLDFEEATEEARFATTEALSAWLERVIQKNEKAGLHIVRYKANDFNIDWLQGINLPEPPPTV